MLPRLRSLFRVLRARQSFEEGMSEELAFHLQQYTEELVRSGLSPQEAARRARMEFGGWNTVAEECREARGLGPWEDLQRDLRYGARLLRKTPGFTLTALLTVAICLGANLTIFSAIDSILLRPLPFPAAERLVTLYNTYPKAGVVRDGASITNYYERRGQLPALASLSIYRHGTAVVGEAEATEREETTQVSPEFFLTLGVGPAMGRTFAEEETTAGNNKVVIVSDAYWREHLQADPQVIGRQLRVDGRQKTVVGVLPPDFHFLSSAAQLYLPLATRPEDRAARLRHSGGNVTQMIARLQPGATVAQAQQQVEAQNQSLEADNPMGKLLADAGFRTVVSPLHADHVAGVRPVLLAMQAAAVGLLLIGAVNLLNLLFLRANARAKEVAVRQALGATWQHVAREVVVETGLLTVLGGALGLAVGAAGIRLLAALGTDRLPLGARMVFDLRLAAIALAGALLLGLLLAMPIAWFKLRSRLVSGMQGETRSGLSTRAAQRLRHSFVVAQIAMAMVLLAVSGLLGKSLERAMAVSPGFRPDHLLTGQIALPDNLYPDWPARLAFNQRVLDGIAQQPGMLAVGLANNIPFSGANGKSAATAKGERRAAGESPRGYDSYGVDGDYFTAMGLALRAGRFLSADDVRRDAHVCVVDEAFARQAWPAGSALGRKLFLGPTELDDAAGFTVVGVVGSVKQAGLTEDAGQGAIYTPYHLRTDPRLYVAVRTSLPPESFARVLQQAVRQADANAAVHDIRTMEDRIADSLVVRRSPAMVAGIFSAIALLLTGLGTYGVLAYAVTQRRQEIGVRMALGAAPEQIRGHFFGLTLRLLAVGTCLGLIGAVLAGKAIQAVLFQVAPLSFVILAGAAGVIGLVALVACLLPSMQAARVSPMEAFAER